VDDGEEVVPIETQSATVSGMQGRLDAVFMVLKKCKFLQEKIGMLEREKERLKSQLADAEGMVKIILATRYKT
jgi:hypothetical protein